MKKKNIFKRIEKNKETIVNIIVLLLIFAFLLTYFTPDLLLSETTTSGGDTGSHHYLAGYLKDYLLPNGKLIGWSPGWYAGFPMFQFYFPLPYLFMAFLSFVIPYEIAFKLVTVLGTFLLPICTFFSFRIMRFKFPLPIIAAVFVLPFLFLENNSMYGGNIPSTLAGEFSYSISLSLSILFMGSLYQGITTRKRLIFNILLLSIIPLFHLFPLIIVVISSLFFIFYKKRVENLKYLFVLFLTSFLLIGFWGIPFITKMGFSSSLEFIQTINTDLVFPETLLLFFLLTGAGIIFALRKKDRRILYLCFTLVVSLIFYLFLPKGYIWNVRFLPIFYLTALLIAAYGLNSMLDRVKLRVLIPIFVLIATVLLVNNSVTFIPHWIRWNYEGYENKADWQTFSEMNSFLNSLPPGRVLHEYSNEHNSMFGTPRALELIPYFTNKATMEGLLIESSITSPYYFYLQSEISKTATCPISTLKCTFFNIDDALKHLRLFNIKYVVATSDKLKNATSLNGNFVLLKQIGKISIYEVDGKNQYVVLPEYEPVIVRDNWEALSMEWFKSNMTDVPLIYTREDIGFQVIDELQDIEKKEIEDCQIEEEVRNEEVLIKTSCIGKPLWVKISYFPNWQADGADVYLASPSLMLIIPYQEDVRLYYGNTAIDWIAILGTIFSILFITNLRFKFIKKLCYP
jgi:hypothetical protein